jgi:hypothetical protein
VTLGKTSGIKRKHGIQQCQIDTSKFEYSSSPSSAPGMHWMNAGLSTLHERYSTQALWTEELRLSLLNKIILPPQPQVLEVGSGTGCITSWTSKLLKKRVWGVDIDYATVQFARHTDKYSGYAQADGGSLPFPDDEMKRCVRHNGWVIAFAEPDYGGRIDYPESLACIGDYQAEALTRSGAHTSRGRELRSLFSNIGLKNNLVGLLGGEWGSDSASGQDSEWAILRKDLDGILSPLDITKLEKLDQQAWENQQRILFTPTFFGMGQKHA